MLIHKLTDKEKELLAAKRAAFAALQAEVDDLSEKLEAKRREASEANSAHFEQVGEIRELYFDDRDTYRAEISEDGEHLIYQRSSFPSPDLGRLGAPGVYEDSRALAQSNSFGRW